MCVKLCKLNGGGFPIPETLVNMNARNLAMNVPVGYRAQTIISTAKLWNKNKQTLCDWIKKDDHEKLHNAMGAINGVGPYSLKHILFLFGFYDDIPVDSEVLSYFTSRHPANKDVTPRAIQDHYEAYSPYRFLAYTFKRMGERLKYIDK